MTPIIQADTLSMFVFGILVGSLISGGIVAWLFTARDPHYKYIPPGSFVLKAKDWKIIERNISIHLAETKSAGIHLGRKQAIKAIQAELTKKMPYKSPYKILGIKVGEEGEVSEKAKKLREAYNPLLFRDLGSEFVQLAELKRAEIEKAVAKLTSYINGNPAPGLESFNE